MNRDEQFEQRLQHQPLQPVPSVWRDEILSAAAARRGDEDAAALVAGWRLLFARMPLAWAALAALWLGMVGLNLTMPGPMVSVTLQSSASAQYAALANLDSPATEFATGHVLPMPAPKAPPVVQPSDVPLPPRSERRRGVDVGEMPSDCSFHRIA
jgi:hypothetical protein